MAYYLRPYLRLEDGTIMKMHWIGVLSAALALAATSLRAQEVDLSTINANYKDPDLVVDVWVDRLESEGREVFDFRQQIADAIGIESGDTVADIGAGTGLFTPLLAARVGARGEVYAVDIVPKFIDYIGAKAYERGLTHVIPVLGTDVATNLEPGSIDVAFVCDTYHHFEDYESMLESIHSALRPGGRLVVVDFERIDGESSDFILEHVRAGKEVVTAEIEAGGFEFARETAIDGMTETYMRHFDRL